MTRRYYVTHILLSYYILYVYVAYRPKLVLDNSANLKLQPRRQISRHSPFVIQWPFLRNVFSLHAIFPIYTRTAPYQSSAINGWGRGPVYMCPDGGGARIEFVGVRKALSHAFYNCCYYHLIKILRTRFLRLFDTHIHTYAHEPLYISVYVCTCACITFCQKWSKGSGEGWVGRRRRRRTPATSSRWMARGERGKNRAENLAAFDVIEHRRGLTSSGVRVISIYFKYNMYI